jgi:hypothetical protein
MKKKRSKETSKILLWLLLIMCGVVGVSTLVYTFIAHDSAPLVTLIERLFALASIGVGFYYWKAKNENLHKYKQDHKIGDIDYEDEVHE